MKDLIERSYQAIRKRGLIDENTLFKDFIRKLEEEVIEVEIITDVDGLVKFTEVEHFIEEWIDVFTVCHMFFKHFNIDYKKEFEKCVIKNETRKD